MPSSPQIERHSDFPSNHVAPRPVAVWLPPGYGDDASTRYPVLYMHDGQNIFAGSRQSFTGEAWEVDRAATRLIQAGEIPPLLIVGVWNTEKRWSEYLPQRPFQSLEGQKALEQLKDAQHIGRPHSDAYLRFLVSELKPFIDRQYRTRPDREHTLTMGSSMGGLVSLYALGQYSQIFGGAGCLSTHWPAMAGVLDAFLESAVPSPGRHRIYFDYGTEALDAQYEPFQQQVDQFMHAQGYREDEDWLTRRFEGADHSEPAWRERVHIPLTFLLPDQE